MILGHLAVSALLHRYMDTDLGPTVTGGVFPDVTDKLLCHVLHLTPSGRMYGHTLLSVAFTTTLVCLAFGARVARAWALGYLGHLVADMDGFVPWLYPFRRYSFEGGDIGLFSVVMRVMRNPLRMGFELALIVWAAWALASHSRSEPASM